jgi:hypothetical protein
MYLISLYERDLAAETSLGGRVSADEIRALAEESQELFECFCGRPFSVLLDYSKANKLDWEACTALNALKDAWFEMGADKVYSVPPNREELVAHQTDRLQTVLEGREEFLSDSCAVDLVGAVPTTLRRVA